MKTNLVFAVLVFLVPSFAIAHVSVRPRDSKPGAEERYTVRVPTEGAVATTHAVLEIPADVTVLEVLPAEGTTFETAKQGDRITSITWKKAIPPKASAEFVFRARNPAAGEIVWKAHQHFSDGTVADWVGVAGDKRPASVTKLSAQSGAGAQSGDAAAIETWLKGYDTAFNAKDLDKLATFLGPRAPGRRARRQSAPQSRRNELVRRIRWRRARRSRGDALEGTTESRCASGGDSGSGVRTLDWTRRLLPRRRRLWQAVQPALGSGVS